jgi:hypothetical protein
MRRMGDHPGPPVKPLDRGKNMPAATPHRKRWSGRGGPHSPLCGRSSSLAPPSPSLGAPVLPQHSPPGGPCRLLASTPRIATLPRRAAPPGAPIFSRPHRPGVFLAAQRPWTARSGLGLRKPAAVKPPATPSTPKRLPLFAAHARSASGFSPPRQPAPSPSPLCPPGAPIFSRPPSCRGLSSPRCHLGLRQAACCREARGMATLRHVPGLILLTLLICFEPSQRAASGKRQQAARSPRRLRRYRPNP